jgi:hypothetical protein
MWLRVQCLPSVPEELGLTRTALPKRKKSTKDEEEAEWAKKVAGAGKMKSRGETRPLTFKMEEEARN